MAIRFRPLKPLALCAVVMSMGHAHGAEAAGPAVTIMTGQGVAPPTAAAIERNVANRRVVKPLLPLPAPLAQSPEQVANASRVQAITLALARARHHESEAAWDACAREAAGALGDAIELLASSTRFALLRDLHVQIGVCMSLGQHPANARPHFLSATLLDETPPPAGLHRQEAELARAQARAELLARTRGRVRIETLPSGADVWIDGVRAPRATPLDATVRLGDHFVTIRRFRWEPRTERRTLQPGSSVRFSLEPARRSTLRYQLAEVAAGARTVTPGELRLARTRWSRAEQLLWVTKPLGPSRGVRLALLDATTGTEIRARMLAEDADEDGVRDTVCATLGEQCTPPDEGVPWYVWPIAGVAVVGAAIALGFIIDGAQEYRFCPSSGCD